jgi:hypothetical protein
VYPPYQGPIVIITYKPIVALLERLHIASEADGITVFDVAKYLQVFNSGERWVDIPGNTTYPSQNRILLWTTDPNESNLGAIFADIAYAAQTGGNPPASIDRHDPYVPVIRNLFTALGELPTHSTLLLQQFLADGMRDHPMATVYESQYLSSVLSGAASNPSLTVMYPTPDIITSDELVAWTPSGEKLIEALSSTPMATLLATEGYRTEGDATGFVTDMAHRGISVLDLSDPGKEPVQIFSPLSPRVLKELTNAVATSQPLSSVIDERERWRQGDRGTAVALG